MEIQDLKIKSYKYRFQQYILIIQTEEFSF